MLSLWSPLHRTTAEGADVTLLGALLFRRCVSGVRVVGRGKQQVRGAIAVLS